VNEHADFTLDERLARDCHTLADLGLSRLLLMNNALLPWFILVPRVEAVELHELAPAQQSQLLEEINLLSRFLRLYFSPDKLNIAAIGNIVRQMHIHLVARRRDDFCWPGVVWGETRRMAYDQPSLDRIARQLRGFLPPQSRYYEACEKP
jgi:diadenosine tetraphosphate (Ap4A) HIT family hydrolase